MLPHEATTVYGLADSIEEVHSRIGTVPGKTGMPKIDSKQGILDQFNDIDFSKRNKIFYIDRTDFLEKKDHYFMSVKTVEIDEEGNIL